MEINIYKEKGYRNREDYFNDLSRSYGVPLFAVHSIAEILGDEEDFDMLPITLGDYSSDFGACFDN